MGDEEPVRHPAGDVEEGKAGEGAGLTRRAMLRDGSLVTLAILAAGPASALGDVAVRVRSGAPTFLTASELETLRALVDRFIPGRPEDSDDGALAAGCAEAIDALLGAFEVDPPRIYAGAPFSDRAGSSVNHFEKFLSLDRYERRAWRLRIQGSRGKRELEFNGPVKGWQATYREGLAALDRAAGGSFAALPGPARDLVLRNSDDGTVAELLDVGWPHTYQFMYGAPEYGGNRNLIGWNYTNYAGDVQPRGWTREQIEQPDPASPRSAPLESAGTPLERLIAIAPLASPEFAYGIVARSGGTVSGLRRELAPIIAAIEGGEQGGP
jgi:Gluconate 2-dehydrogenase subunit 3